MLAFFKKLFGGKNEELERLIQEGAVIIDVRTPGEFKGGHVKGSINIPLDKLSSNTGKLKKDKPIITCCASGMRSGSAKGMLSAKGFTVYNGGSWTSLNRYIA